MLAPSPAFQKALMSIADQNREDPTKALTYDEIDWDTLPESINFTRSHVRTMLGARQGRKKSIDDSVVGIKLPATRRRGALTGIDTSLGK